MAEIKGIEKLTQTVEYIVHDIINMEEVDIAFGTDFSCDPETAYVLYSILNIPEQNSQFNECALKNFGFAVQDEIDEFCLSLLHELGHVQTWNAIPTRVKRTDEIKKFFIRLFKNYRKVSIKYYSLPTEYAATKWACRWAFRHHLKYNRMRNEISNALKEFYKENHLTSD